MRIILFEDRYALGQAAARDAAHAIRGAITDRGRATILAATGASQFEFLAALTRERDVDWSSVEMFHLDEYIGLAPDHPASFRRFLLDRLIGPTGVRNLHLIDGQADPEQVCRGLGRDLQASSVDVA